MSVIVRMAKIVLWVKNTFSGKLLLYRICCKFILFMIKLFMYLQFLYISTVSCIYALFHALSSINCYACGLIPHCQNTHLNNRIDNQRLYIDTMTL